MKETKRNLNNEIKAKNIQLINEEGENLGIMPLSEALKRAEDSNLDLMEIWRKDDLVIAKILDYWKHLYKLKKQDQKNKQKSKVPELKTIRITFNIGEHDLGIRRKQAEWFAKDWNPLKIVLMMRWRENQYSEIAKTKLENFVVSLEDIYKKEREVSKMWNVFSINLKPIK